MEFLTDNLSRNNKDQNVTISGIYAQPLSYLSLSLELNEEFKTFEGERGKVISPSAWMLHKALTFNRRKARSKALKDLYGIWYVATQLGIVSSDAVDEIGDLSQYHPKWYKRALRNIDTWIESASPLDWQDLESQDPSGSLKKLNFVRVMKKFSQ